MREILLLLIIFLSSNAINALNGKITDQLGHAVPNAKIQLINTNDSTFKFSTITNSLGEYSIAPWDKPGTNISGFKLFDNYPNPVIGNTYIPLYLPIDAVVEISIANMMGQKVSILHSGLLSAGVHQIPWDGKFNSEAYAPSGIYTVNATVGNYRMTKKMLVIHSKSNQNVSKLSDSKFGQNTARTDNFNVYLSANGFMPKLIKQVNISPDGQKNFEIKQMPAIPYAVNDNYLTINDGSTYNPFYINGINLGVSVPGTTPGDLAATSEQYARWFKRIVDIGFNSIRSYTLHFPRFYEEFYKYNIENPDKPLYLFQGIWLDEPETPTDLFTSKLTTDFQNEIKKVINVVHGNAVVPASPGRANGTYTYDISPWTMAYIIGREVAPAEIWATDSAATNKTKTEFIGSALSITNASPSEVWFTNQLDYTVMYERTQYKTERPVSNSSWPTLDPLKHPSERADSDEDKAQLQLNKVNSNFAPAGFFASYHAYPYYPDFISVQPSYQAFADKYGPNSYLGYLYDLKSNYDHHPLIIAEFGVPSSVGNAHTSFSGMNHGGNTYEQQGTNNLRLMANIHDTKCGGGFLFSWIDEWFKRAWITDPISINAPERKALFHDVTNPEQNFGLVTFDPAPIAENATINGSCNIQSTKCTVDPEYFKITTKLTELPNEADPLWIALDTYKAELGESILPNGQTVANRAEFALKITADSAQLYVTQAYNTFAIWFGESSPEQLYKTIATDGKPWNEVEWKNNFPVDSIQKIGKFNVSKTGNYANNLQLVALANNQVNIRIPWTLLNFIDPAARSVMYDDRDTRVRETAVTDGIALTLFYKTCKLETPRQTWPTWDKDAIFDFTKFIQKPVEREKPTLEIIKNGLKTLDLTPLP